MTHEALTERILDLEEDAYTPAQIALATGVTEEEVKYVLSRYRRRSEQPRPLGRSRCNGCGAIVAKPCLLCRQRRIGSVTPAMEGGGPLPGDPSESEILRLAAELRKKRRPERYKYRPGPPAIREFWLNDLIPQPNKRRPGMA